MSRAYSTPTHVYSVHRHKGPWSETELWAMPVGTVHHRAGWTALVIAADHVLLGDAHASPCTMLGEARWQYREGLSPFDGFKLDPHAQELLEAAGRIGASS